jgi:predicted hotdog family 3-hydroxylacyl-ACP dehydratase
MILQRDQLCALIPHAGAMCLLDRVERWDETEILCSTGSHRRPDNPLREGDRLASIHALEYGAQAMAVHGGLLARQQQTRIHGGFLVALRDVRLYRDRLDDLPDTLRVEASQLLAADANQIYRVRISCDDNLVADGRLSVMNHLEGNP